MNPYRKQIGKQENQKLVAKAVQQSLHRWESLFQRDLNFNSLLRSSPQLISFTLGITFVIFGLPANLKQWGLSNEESCCLCDAKNCTVGHILTSCLVAFVSGRYRFRHDSVLKVLAHHIVFQQSFTCSKVPSQCEIDFIKEEKVASRKTKKGLARLDSLLTLVADWKLLTDVESQLLFLNYIDTTSLCINLLLYSNSRRIVIIIDLTYLLEEKFTLWKLENTSKYADLVACCKFSGWNTCFFAVELEIECFASGTL